MKLVLVGNVGCAHSSETHHALSLESLGHDVVKLQEGRATGEQILEESLAADALVFVHTHSWSTPGLELETVLRILNRAGTPTLTYHLDLWRGLQRQRDLDRDPFYRSIGWFFTVDKLMADWFRQKTAVKGEFMPAGVLEAECYISDGPSEHANDVIFVGSRNYHHEWRWRGELLDWLRKTYGSRFTHIGGDGDTGTIRGEALNRAYANSKVAVGDTLCIGFEYPFYASDRLFECAGRGGAQVWPYIKGVDDWFTDREHLRFFQFGDFDNLRDNIDYLLEHDDERENMRRAGHELVKNNHTYRHRWQTILDTVFS